MTHEARILIVDDQEDNRLILEDLLGGHYLVHAEPDGPRALDYLAGGGRPDLILLDVMMPGIDGFEVCQQIKDNPDRHDIPVLFISGLDSAADEERGLALGAEDFVRKPFSPSVVLARVRTHLKLAQARRFLRDRNAELEQVVAERTLEIVFKSAELMRQKQDVIATQEATIIAFCALAEARDNETGNHIRRTQNYVKALAEKLCDHPRFAAEVNDETIPLLFKSAPLHDVGKVAIPDRVLLKPGKLTPEEWEIMKRHATYGGDAIAQAENGLGSRSEHGDSFLRYAREIAYGHHEKWDGTGYPLGLAGEAIPVSARLMAVADVYDALISKRVYKAAFSHDQAIAMIIEQRGRHFDPDMIDALIAIADEFQDIAADFCDESGGDA